MSGRGPKPKWSKPTYPPIEVGRLLKIEDGRYLWVVATNGDLLTCVIWPGVDNSVRELVVPKKEG
jgi:hypothetical protein